MSRGVPEFRVPGVPEFRVHHRVPRVPGTPYAITERAEFTGVYEGAWDKLHEGVSRFIRIGSLRERIAGLDIASRQRVPDSLRPATRSRSHLVVPHAVFRVHEIRIAHGEKGDSARPSSGFRARRSRVHIGTRFLTDTAVCPYDGRSSSTSHPLCGTGSSHECVLPGPFLPHFVFRPFS